MLLPFIYEILEKKCYILLQMLKIEKFGELTSHIL